MRKLLLIFLLLLLSACAIAPRRVERLPWPTGATAVTGEGELDMTFGERHFSGPFIVRAEHPDLLVVEVYGPFGQTVVYVRKEAGRFLLVTGEEKTDSEAAFEKKYGFRVEQFTDDLLVRGPVTETPEGLVADRGNYLVRYGYDRSGRRKACWESEAGSICLAFDEVSFARQ